MPQTRIHAIVLAAGTSSRFGDANKLLMPFGDRAVVRCAVDAIRASGVARVVVITGYDAGRVRDALAGLSVEFVHNAGYREGEMLSSIKVGLAHLSAASDAHPTDAALIALGDQPLVPARVIRRLIQAYARGCAEILAPMVAGVRGHPVLMARRWWPEAQALPPGAQMRSLLQANPQAVAHLLVNTDAVIRDVDTRALYAEALRRVAYH